MQKSKRYTITINGRVQEVGFRGYLEDVCNRLRIPSIVYNAPINEIKLLCETDPKTLKELSSHIKRYKIAEIKDVRIDEGVELPYPPFRAVTEIEQEIFTRLDEGVKILHSIKSDTQRLDEGVKILYSIKSDTQKLDKLDEITETLKEISGKL